jgi:uncharacterized protein (DUF305 family)
MHARRTLAAVAAFALLLAACDDGGTADGGEPDAEQASPRVVQPGAPGEPSRELSPEEVDALEDTGDGYSPADVEFVHGMIAHHVQALRMTRLVPERTTREDIPLLAERMDISQEDELRLMQDWLEDRDEPVPSLLAEHEAHHDGGEGQDPDLDDELMPGMLTEAELEELEAADGETFDRLFLEGMITHHLGALQMVEDHQAQADGDSDLGLAAFANHIYGDQEIEITRMRAMLEELEDDAG